MKKTHFRNGKVKNCSIMCQKGTGPPVKDGISISWDKDGQWCTLVEYKNDVQEGLYVTIGPNNSILLEMRMVRGKARGRTLSFSVKGDCTAFLKSPEDDLKDLSDESISDFIKRRQLSVLGMGKRRGRKRKGEKM